MVYGHTSRPAASSLSLRHCLSSTSSGISDPRGSQEVGPEWWRGRAEVRPSGERTVGGVGLRRPGIRKSEPAAREHLLTQEEYLLLSSHIPARSIGRAQADLNLSAFKLVIMMKLRHKNKKPGEGSKGHKKPTKQNGKKATFKVPNALHLVHSNDHASQEAELKKRVLCIAEIVKEVTEVFDIEDTEQANKDTMECLATGESDELLGDMDPLEMEIKLLHSSMTHIADAIESKTTMYKIGDLTGYCTNLNHHQMGWAKCNVNHHPENNNMVDVCSLDCCPVLQRIMEMDPLQQGQALASALKNKMMQKLADEIASKLSDSTMSALDLSGSAYDGVGD
ncbi:Guanine nucleotide-binding protein-like 3-like protein [Plecturocebus cupreus]